MAEHVWTVLCRTVLVDPRTNIISLSDVTEKFTLDRAEFEEEFLEATQSQGKKGLTLPVQMVLVSRWIRSDLAKPESSQERLTLLSPSGEALSSQVVPIDLTDFNTRRITARIEELPLTTAGGLYWFLVEKEKAARGKVAPGWTAVAKLPLDFELL